MTQFSSKPPFNDDPTPWVRTHPDLGYMGRFESRFPNDTHSDYQMKYSPRPEYNRPQHNPTNPILVACRTNPGEPIYYRNLERWPTWEEVEHARKVLTRMKAVFV